MTNVRSITWLLALVVWAPFSPQSGTCARAQNLNLTRAYPAVTVSGAALELPWFGGLNAPQYQAVDLDGDGDEDLLIYDRAGQISLAARLLDDGTYANAPDLLQGIPAMENWMIIRDYNLDGTPDLFCHDEEFDGIKVYHGQRRPDGLLDFERVRIGDNDVVNFNFGDEQLDIFVSGEDYPAIADVDADGDLDILTFNILGGYLELFQNIAVERGLGTDTLVFSLESMCWGGFFESGLSSALNLTDSPGDCFVDGFGNRPTAARHTGSTVLALDYSGNGLTDILLGDVSFPTLTLGLNGGTPEQAWIVEQDPTWNSDGVVADIPYFPAAFHLDADHDGDRDILAAPTVFRNGADVEVGWLYENVGSDAEPDFQFQTSTFLVNEMIDVGSRSNVTSLDYDADGRIDLIVGNNDSYTGQSYLDSRLRLYRNVGQNGSAAFELINDDYLGLSAYSSTTWAFAPTFGDLDGDGDVDAIVGERDGELIFLENTAGAGNPVQFGHPIFEYMEIDAGQFSKPFISDLDRDGLADLLVGGFDGRIRFYRNIGSPGDPAFDSSLDAAGNVLQLGAIDTRSAGSSTGHPTPSVVQHDDYTLLLTGNSAGVVEAYRFGLDTALEDSFSLLHTQVGGLDVGAFSNPDFADFDGDGLLEMVIGNERGGVSFYRSNLRTDGTVPIPRVPQPDFELSAYPNPTSGVTTFTGWPGAAVRKFSIRDARGRRLFMRNLDGADTELQWNAGNYPPGVYLATLTGPGGTAIRRIIVR